MKALHVIVALCIASSFSLNSMDKTVNEKKITQFTALDGPFDKIGRYCSYLPWRKNNQDCIMINAYLLLSRYPNNSVEEQIEFHEKNLSATIEKVNTEANFIEEHNLTYSYEMDKLQRIKLNQDSIITEIQKANLSGKIQDKDIQEKLNTSFNNIVKSKFRSVSSYERQLDLLNLRIEFQQKILGSDYIINNSKN